MNDIVRNHVADLYWLAHLLTGSEDVSVDIAADTVVSDQGSPIFADWMRSWQRRLVIGRALTAIHGELADSARRTQLARVNNWAAPRGNWSLNPDTTKADLEQAMLSIDLFPRAAVLLLVFEGIRMADAAVLLGADPALIRKAQAIGLRELTANLAHEQVTEAPKKLCWLPAVCH
jgi:DNA-directed RNA polymerase specialized sigma24 family protein